MPAPSAVGYLRSDVSGTHQAWHETQIRSLAGRLGFDLQKTVVFGPHTDQPIHRLHVVLSRTGAAAVIVPSVDHFDAGHVPDDIIAVADVVTVTPENRYARTGIAN